MPSTVKFIICHQSVNLSVTRSTEAVNSQPFTSYMLTLITQMIHSFAWYDVFITELWLYRGVYNVVLIKLTAISWDFKYYYIYIIIIVIITVLFEYETNDKCIFDFNRMQRVLYGNMMSRVFGRSFLSVLSSLFMFTISIHYFIIFCSANSKGSICLLVK